MGFDRNASTSMRLRRNQQRTKDGAVTATVAVVAPLFNTGSQIQLNLASAGGLQNASGNLQIKKRDTSFTLDTSGVGIALKTNSCLTVSNGVGVLLMANPGLQTTVTGLGVLLNATTPALSLVGGLTVTLDGTTLEKTATGLRIKAGGVGATELGIETTKGDLISYDTAPNRLGVGSDGQVLTADATQSLGIKWATPIAHVYSEVPSGVIDGSNVDFTLAATPLTDTVRVYKNGLRLKPTTDYTVSGNTITFVVAPIVGDVLLADYDK